MNTPSAAGETIAPSVPFNVRGRGLTFSSIRLDWNASTDAGGSGMGGYRVYRGGSLISGAGLVTSTTYTDTGLSANTTYAYTVTAVDNANNTSAASAAANVTTPFELVFTDDFNRADSSGLNNPTVWSSSGSWQVLSNQAQNPTGNYTDAWSVATSNNTRVTVTINNNNNRGGILFWGTSTTPYYLVYIESGNLLLYYFDPAVGFSLLQSGFIGTASGSRVLKVEATSSTRNIKVTVDGSTLWDFTDTNTTRSNSGKTGMTGGPNQRLDNFTFERW